MLACLLLAACGTTVGATRPASPSPVEWSIHDAAGLRIAAPAAWGAPEVLPATDASGGPRVWVVFRDASGAEALTIMTWRDTTATAVAAAQYGSELPQGDRLDLTLRDSDRT